MRKRIPTEGDTETNGEAESEGKTIPRLPHPGIHPTYSYKTHTIINAHKCWLIGARYSYHLGASSSA